jgi:hypothetical protein
MAKVGSRRPLTAEARVRAWVGRFGVCGGKSGTGTRFCTGSSVFHCSYHSTVALNTYIYLGGWWPQFNPPTCHLRHTLLPLLYLKTTVFCIATVFATCSLVEIYRRFRDTTSVIRAVNVNIQLKDVVKNPYSDCSRILELKQ